MDWASRFQSTANADPLLALSILLAGWSLQVWGQELSPRAYFITPVNSNAITLIGSFYTGGVDFNGTSP